MPMYPYHQMAFIMDRLAPPILCETTTARLIMLFMEDPQTHTLTGSETAWIKLFKTFLKIMTDTNI